MRETSLARSQTRRTRAAAAAEEDDDEEEGVEALLASAAASAATSFALRTENEGRRMAAPARKVSQRV